MTEKTKKVESGGLRRRRVRSDPAGSPRSSLRERQSEETRRALIKTARRLFTERGYAGTSMEEVVARAGMSRGALYHQFRDKRALFDAVIRATAEDAFERGRDLTRERAIAEGGARQSWERAVAAIELGLDALLNPSLRRLLVVEGPAVLGPEVTRDILEEHLLGRTRGGFRSYSKHGILAADLPERMPDLIVAMLFGAANLVAHADDPAEMRAEVGEALAWMMERMRGDERPSE